MIISIHIPKNAGNSFYSALKDIYGNQLQTDYRDRIASEDYLKRKSESYPKIKPGTRVIHGHFQAKKYLEKYPTAEFITWFREPVERIASIYYFWKINPDWANPTCVKMLEEKYSLMEFARMPEIKDMQPYLIQPLKPEDFKFFGIVEHYSMSIDLFKNSMGIKKNITRYKHNVNPKRSIQYKKISGKQREEIEKIHAEGVDLYKRAKKLFFQRYLISKFPPLKWFFVR